VSGWSYRRTATVALHLAPAFLVGLLMAGLLDGMAGALVGFGPLFVAPGWLLWKVLRGPISTDPLALPALWLVFSFPVSIPAVGPMVFFGGPVLPVEWYVLIVLVALGVAGSLVPSPQLERPGRMGIAVAAAGALAMVFRALTWHGGGDDLSFLGYLRATYLGGYPSVNPFLVGDLPVSQRWRFSGWTGISGVLSHLGDTDPELILRNVLAVLLVPFAASALYLLGRVLSGDRKFAVAAGFAALIVPLITGTAGKSGHKFLYDDLAYDKFTALLIFVPVVAALLVMFYRSPRRSTGILVSAVLWASLFTHAVTILIGVGTFFVFMLIDRIVTRPPQWRSAAKWSLAVVAPLLVTAALASLAGERHGTLASDVTDLADIAAPTIQLGPIELWEPLSPMSATEIVAAGPEDAAAIFSRGYATMNESPVVVFLPNGWPLPHPRTLNHPRYLIAAFAALMILAGRYRDGVALWILASTAAMLSVYLIPPVAVLAARFITPWQVWRLAWVLPVPLAAGWIGAVWLRDNRWPRARGIAVGLLLGLVLGLASHSTLLRTGPSGRNERRAATIEQLEGYSGVLLARPSFLNLAVSRWPELLTVSHRGFSSMSNAFPASRQDETLQRYADVRFFFRNASTEERLTILDRYGVRYIVIHRDDADRLDVESLGLDRVEGIGQGNLLYERR
jgi:hypothetical protein